MFDRLKNIKTPHGNPLKHLRNLFAYFFCAALLVMCFNIGSAVVESLVSTVAAAAVTALIALVGGIFVTMIFRATFKLVQTGRFLQYGGFWLASWLALKASAWLFASTLVVTNSLLSSLILFALAFGSATICGEVPTRGRTWLPVKAKR